jgi:hypothetical protein
MRGMPILLIFFLMFTVACLLVPTPMFPGNLLSYSIGPAISQYAEYFSALFNGIFYGVVVWLVFVGISRKLEPER